MSADESYSVQNDTTSDLPAGAEPNASDYTSSSSNEGIVKDDAPVEDPIDDKTADSDEVLGMSSFSPPI